MARPPLARAPGLLAGRRASAVIRSPSFFATPLHPPDLTLIGFALPFFGAEGLVSGAAALAEQFGVSPLVTPMAIAPGMAAADIPFKAAVMIGLAVMVFRLKAIPRTAGAILLAIGASHAIALPSS